MTLYYRKCRGLNSASGFGAGSFSDRRENESACPIASDLKQPQNRIASVCQVNSQTHHSLTSPVALNDSPFSRQKALQRPLADAESRHVRTGRDCVAALAEAAEHVEKHPPPRFGIPALC
jgi:hypothetical protein